MALPKGANEEGVRGSRRSAVGRSWVWEDGKSVGGAIASNQVKSTRETTERSESSKIFWMLCQNKGFCA